MNHVSTITADQTLTLIKGIIARYQKFALITDDDDRIVIEPLDEEDAKPYYEPSPEGEASLKEAMAQAARGEVYPIETLFKKDA